MNVHPSKLVSWTREPEEGEKDPEVMRKILGAVDGMLAEGWEDSGKNLGRERCAQMLVALSEGKSLKWIKDTFGVSLREITRLENRYHEHLGDWRDHMRQKYQERYIGFEYAINMAASRLVERMEKGQLAIDPDAIMKLAKAADLTAKTVLTLNGEASQITEQRTATSPQEVEDWRRKFLESLPEAEGGEVVDRGSGPDGGGGGGG